MIERERGGVKRTLVRAADRPEQQARVARLLLERMP